MRNLPPAVRELVLEAARNMDISEGSVLSRSHEPQCVAARAAVFAALRLRGYSYTRIGNLFGYNHATVIHLVKGPVPRLRPRPASTRRDPPSPEAPILPATSPATPRAAVAYSLQDFWDRQCARVAERKAAQAIYQQGPKKPHENPGRIGASL